MNGIPTFIVRGLADIYPSWVLTSGRIVFFTLNCMQPIPRLHIAARDVQSSRHIVSEQSLVLAGHFSNDPW